MNVVKEKFEKYNINHYDNKFLFKFFGEEGFRYRKPHHLPTDFDLDIFLNLLSELKYYDFFDLLLKLKIKSEDFFKIMNLMYSLYYTGYMGVKWDIYNMRIFPNIIPSMKSFKKIKTYIDYIFNLKLFYYPNMLEKQKNNFRCNYILIKDNKDNVNIEIPIALPNDDLYTVNKILQKTYIMTLDNGMTHRMAKYFLQIGFIPIPVIQAIVEKLYIFFPQYFTDIRDELGFDIIDGVCENIIKENFKDQNIDYFEMAKCEFSMIVAYIGEYMWHKKRKKPFFEKYQFNFFSP